MTLNMTCDICQRSEKVTLSATCKAENHGREVSAPPTIEIKGQFSSQTKWTETFINGHHGHECSQCARSRRETLEPQLEVMEATLRKSVESKRKEARNAWVASRRGQS